MLPDGDIYLEEAPCAAEVAAQARVASQTAVIPSTTALAPLSTSAVASAAANPSSSCGGDGGPRLRSLPLLSELVYAETMAAMATGAAPPHPDLVAGATAAARRSQLSSLAPSCSSASTARRDRSLGVLTQRYIKLFMLDRKVREGRDADVCCYFIRAEM